ncbi:MAG: sugar ABC transporter permease, partial [Thermotogaceae bacterium]|nr:sugar ABC transporter permease [Thermotogaceae bacterium]
VIIPIQLVLAIALALLVNSKFKGYSFLLYIISIPLALSDVTAGLMSYTIFAPMGYLNKVLLNLGWIEHPIYFFGFMYQTREFWVIVLTEIWRATPLVFVIILAGLQSINKEYLEAADIFGFTRAQKLFKIILPLLKPSIMSALLMRTLFAFQIFGVVWMLAGRDIPVLAGETYYQYIQLNNPKMASAYGVIIAIVTLIVSIIYNFSFQAKHLEGGRES